MRFGRPIKAVLASLLLVFPATAVERDAAWEACFGINARDIARGCTVLLERNPFDLSARVQRGEVLQAGKDADRARADFDAVIAAKAASSADHSARGRALHALGRDQEAREAFDRAVAIDPTQGMVRADRALFELDISEDGRARADFDAAIALSPDDPIIRNFRLRFSMERNDTALMIEDIEALARLDQNAEPWLSLLVSLRLRAGQPHEALVVTDRLVELAPLDSRTNAQRALVLDILGRLHEAVAEYREALRLSPNDILIEGSLRSAEARAEGRPVWRPHRPQEVAGEVSDLVASAKVWTAMGRPAEARKALDRALELDSRSPIALKARAALALDQGEAAAALRDLDHLLRFFPDDAEAHGLRGRARAVESDFDGAEDDLDIAIASLPPTPALHAARARVRESRGDKDGAASDRAMAVRLQAAN